MFSRFILMLASSCAFLVEAQTNARRQAPSTTSPKPRGGSKKGGRNKAPADPADPADEQPTLSPEIEALIAAIQKAFAALEEANSGSSGNKAGGKAPKPPPLVHEETPQYVALRPGMP